MSDSGKNSHAFDEDALKQALNESLEIPAHSGQENLQQENSNNGISWIVMAVIFLSAAGFTASSWMANQKIAALKVQIENIEIRMNNSLSVDADQVTHEKAQHAINIGQKNEATLMQLATQIMENREGIEALKQLVANTAAQNYANTAIMLSVPPAFSSEDSIASPVSPKADEAEIADRVAGMKIAETAKKAGIAKQETSMPETAKPVLLKNGRGWNIVLMSLKNEAMADRELAALLKNGYQAEKHIVKVHGETFHQLRVGWFEQKDDALAYLKNVIAGMGYKDAWIRHMQ
jgi:cell division septation protein DedD